MPPWCYRCETSLGYGSCDNCREAARRYPEVVQLRTSIHNTAPERCEKCGQEIPAAARGAK